MITLAAEFCFAVIFLGALWSYLRRRDPLQRDVVWVFAPCAALFAVDVARQLGANPPAQVSALASAFLLALPVLALRLAGRLRTVPRWVTGALLLAYALAAGPLLVAPRPLAPELVLLAVTVFVLSSLVAAGFLAAEARSRTGSSRVRLRVAAGSTVVFAAAVMALGIGAVAGTGSWFTTASRILALLSALGYGAAFLPPPSLRRWWSAASSQDVAARLLRAPARSAAEVWQSYAEMVREHTAADAVAVLVRATDGGVTQTAYAGPPATPPTGLDSAALDALTAARQPVPLPTGRRREPADRPDAGFRLAAHYGGQIGAGFVTALPMRVLPDECGAVLVFTRHRSLSTDDELRLLADLGGQAGILAERQDVIAEQQRLTAELTASVAALTRASEAKSDFLANMSHELRTPLNAIIGFSDLMRMEEPVGDRRSVPADWIDHIHSSGRHLLGLINDILDLAKVEAGRLDLRPGALRVDTAVTETLTNLRPLLDAKQLRLDADLAPVSALADPVRFRQILENLLSNAIKFTPEQGRITVTAALDGDSVVLAVADTGVGIATADLDRVFEEFQQVGDRTRHRSGTGLGLALTRRLVQAHGGDIELTSQLGHGSRFSVRLPAAPQPSAIPAAPTADPAGGARVLVIEDDPRSAELLRTYLLAAGYQVTVADTGESGLASACADPPAAILLDVNLPGIDGWEVIRRLKAEPQLAGIPVLFATIVDERQAGINLGATDYFVKPVDPGRLLKALTRHLAGRIQDPPTVLVVDGDPQVGHVAEEELRAAGADVVACTDRQEGLRLSRLQRFDLIVCELTPEGDGIGLLTALGQEPTNRATPVVGLGPTAEGARPALVATAARGTPGWETLKSMAAGMRPADTEDEESPVPQRPAGQPGSGRDG